MPINADQLEAFWTVVQAGGYHAAADRLFISQSAVTQRIQALEAHLGQRLFMRAGRGVTLTEAGQILMRHCQDSQQAEAGLLAALRGDGESLVGRLAVAAGSAEGRLWLLPAVAELTRRHPGLDLVVLLDDLLDAAALLESCRVDAVLSETPPSRRGLRTRALGRTGYRLVASAAIAADWPAEPSAEQLFAARAIDFDPRDRITLEHLALCLPEADPDALRRHFVNDTQGILELTLAGGGFAVLPSRLIAAHLAAGSLQAYYPAVTSQRTLYWTEPNGARTPALRALEGVLRGLIS